MSDPTQTIQCKKCAATFQPDIKARGPWVCPTCQAKNPNLKRHYRSVADLCILGFIATILLRILSLGFKIRGLGIGTVFAAAHAILLLVTIVFIYKSKAPWRDAAAKTLIWVVFVLALLFNVGIPLLPGRELNVPLLVVYAPLLVVYAIVFGYLFWLNSQARKCTPSEAPAVQVEDES